MHDVCKRLGRNVRKHRKASELSQEALAHAAGLHRTYLSDIERGVRNPTITVVEQIARALGVTASALIE